MSLWRSHLFFMMLYIYQRHWSDTPYVVLSHSNCCSLAQREKQWHLSQTSQTYCKTGKKAACQLCWWGGRNKGQNQKQVMLRYHARCGLVAQWTAEHKSAHTAEEWLQLGLLNLWAITCRWSFVCKSGERAGKQGGSAGGIFLFFPYHSLWFLPTGSLDVV